jgi:hypothetical protein
LAQSSKERNPGTATGWFAVFRRGFRLKAVGFDFAFGLGAGELTENSSKNQTLDVEVSSPDRTTLVTVLEHKFCPILSTTTELEKRPVSQRPPPGKRTRVFARFASTVTRAHPVTVF